MNRKVNVDLILQFRESTKMSIKEFCERSNIGITTYYSIVKNRMAKVETLYGIARTMNISLNQLLNQ